MSKRSRAGLCPAETPDGMEDRLRDLAHEIAFDLSGLEEAQSKALLGTFVSESFLAVAKQERQAAHRQRQAEGIAAAKARGVRFGPSRRSVPKDLDKWRQEWRNGNMTMAEAAEACGMPRSTFYDAAIREERSAGCGA